MPKELKSSPTPAQHPRVSPTSKRNPGLQILIEAKHTAKHKWFADNTPGPGASELHQWVWARMTAPERAFSLFQPKAGSTWVDYAPGEIAQAAKELVDLLKQLSKKQRSVALGVLADMATDTTIILSGIAKTDTQLLVPVAKKRILWPVLTSSMKGFGDDAKEITKGIELGAVPVISVDLIKLKTSRIAKTATRKAVELISVIESQRGPAGFQFSQPAEWERLARKVKPFSAKTWPTWFEIAWMKVLDDNDGKPENSKELRSLGTAQAERVRRRFLRSAGAEIRFPGSERDGIQQQLRSAFESLSGARKKPPAPMA